MRGHLRQRGTDSFQLIVYAGRDPLTGKDRCVRKTFKGSKRAAQQALARLVTEVGDGEHVGTDLTFAELLERWYERSVGDWSPATAREHRGIIDRHLARRRPRRAGPGGALEVAPDQPRLQRHTTPGRRPRNHAARPQGRRPVTAELAGVDAPLHAYVRLAATSGARRSQIVGLRWCDIDFDAATATFARSVVLGPSGIEVRTTTKGNRVYRIALDAGTLTVLAGHQKRCIENALACGVSLPSDAYGFSNDVEGAEPWRPGATTHRFSRVCAKAGLTGVRLHDLRHYVATRMLSSGADVRTVAGRLGHANLSVTLNVYAQFLPQSDRKAAEALAALLDEPEVS